MIYLVTKVRKVNSALRLLTENEMRAKANINSDFVRYFLTKRDAEKYVNKMSETLLGFSRDDYMFLITKIRKGR